jgi:hypothetical protein
MIAVTVKDDECREKRALTYVSGTRKTIATSIIPDQIRRT